LVKLDLPCGIFLFYVVFNKYILQFLTMFVNNQLKTTKNFLEIEKKGER